MAFKCVHKGCGKEFTDPEEQCLYHPGPPVFHEGQKGKLKRTLLFHLAFYLRPFPRMGESAKLIQTMAPNNRLEMLQTPRPHL